MHVADRMDVQRVCGYSQLSQGFSLSNNGAKKKDGETSLLGKFHNNGSSYMIYFQITSANIHRVTFGMPQLWKRPFI